MTVVTFQLAYLQPTFAGNALCFQKEVRVIKTIEVNPQTKGTTIHCTWLRRNPGAPSPKFGFTLETAPCWPQKEIQEKMELSYCFGKRANLPSKYHIVQNCLGDRRENKARIIKVANPQKCEFFCFVFLVL